MISIVYDGDHIIFFLGEFTFVQRTFSYADLSDCSDVDYSSLRMHQFPILGLELVELVGIGIGRNWKWRAWVSKYAFSSTHPHPNLNGIVRCSIVLYPSDA